MRDSGIAALLVAAALLAGCSGGSSSSSSGDELLVTSDLPDEVVVSEDQPQEAPEKKRERGHVKGFVLSADHRPLEGALVRIPGMDKEALTDREGFFGFVDLYAGPTYMTFNATGYYGASKEVDVSPAEFLELKVLLTPIPPPTPYHPTQTFKGYADLTDATFGILRGWTCSGCVTPVFLDMVPETLVIEAVTNADVTFDLYLNSPDGWGGDVARLSSPSPLHIALPRDQLMELDRFELAVYPSSLVPQTAVEFDFYVTPFYHEPAPEGWSFVAGDV